MIARRAFLLAIAASTAAACAARKLGPAADRSLDASRFAAARRFVTTRHGRIAYVERGTGDAALFLHGFPLNSFQWRDAIERLSPLRRCIAPDLLGLGHTEVAEGQGVAPADQVDMLIALLDALGIAKVDVVANASGGAVAQLLIAEYPERIRSVLLTNCATEQDSPSAAMAQVIELARKGELAERWFARWRADHALARSAEGIGGMGYADPARLTDEAIEAYFAPLLVSPRRVALAHAHAIALANNPLVGTQYAINCCQAPVRIVWGTRDTVFSPSSADYLDRMVGSSRGVRRLPDSKLLWPEERPDVIAEEARALWRAA